MKKKIKVEELIVDDFIAPDFEEISLSDDEIADSTPPYLIDTKKILPSITHNKKTPIPALAGIAPATLPFAIRHKGKLAVTGILTTAAIGVGIAFAVTAITSLILISLPITLVAGLALGLVLGSIIFGAKYFLARQRERKEFPKPMPVEDSKEAKFGSNPYHVPAFQQKHVRLSTSGNSLFIESQRFSILDGMLRTQSEYLSQVRKTQKDVVDAPIPSNSEVEPLNAKTM